MEALSELTEGAVPLLIFLDREQYLLAMEAVPQPHANFKALPFSPLELLLVFLPAAPADWNVAWQMGMCGSRHDEPLTAGQSNELPDMGLEAGLAD